MTSDYNSENNKNIENISSNGNFSNDSSINQEISVENNKWNSNGNFPDDATIVEEISIEKQNDSNPDSNNEIITDLNDSNYSDYKRNLSGNENSDAISSETVSNNKPHFINYNSDSENLKEPEIINENISNNKNVKKVTKPSKIVIFAIICIALVGGITIGTFLGAPVIENVKNYINQYINEFNNDKNSDIKPTSKPENPAINNNGEILTYASEDPEESALSTAEIAQKCLPSVVEIRTETVSTGSFFQDFVTEGAGSGVIITKDGYIVTNYHVIESTNKIFVTLNDGEEYKAKLIGSDEKSDLAVVKIEKTGLTPAIIGDSDKLVVGEKAVAIGNPLGELGGTVTDGIISALDREMTIEGQKMTLLQTNAAINPGNSGGGLFNGLGNLIAIVDAKSSGTGIEGLGFAIPSNKMAKVVNQIIEFGYVKGYVDTGMTFIDITDPYTAMQYRVGNLGVYVLKVYGDSALSQGFKAGDLVLEVNGTKVSSKAEIDSLIENLKVGDEVKFEIYRNFTNITLTLKLDEYVPENQTKAQ